MRATDFIAVAALLWASPAWAGQSTDEPAPAPPVNQIDIGGRASNVDGDAARFQHFRDLRDGATLDKLRYDKRTDLWKVDFSVDHAGYRDQRYEARVNRYGRVKASFTWDQIPLFYSEDTRTLYTSPSPGVLRLDDSLQQGLQNKTLSLANVVGQATPIDTRLRRDVADFQLTFQASRTLDLNVSLKNTHKTGSQPWGATFGFSDDVIVAAPVDHRTTDLASSLEWSYGRGVVQVGYNGSFFRNKIDTLVWDNPLVATDAAGAPSEGRESMWPDTTMNAGNVTGTLSLPARSHATAYLSVGNWTNNAPLIPFTINSALRSIPLDRSTADVKAVVTAMNYTFTTRPTNALWFSARFKRYNFDNRSPEFLVPLTVTYDTNVSTLPVPGTEPFSYVRNTVDAETSFTPAATPHVAYRLGFTREAVDRTFRTFETTTEDTIRASVDSTGLSWLTLRGVYEHGKRTGTGLDEQALDTIGEQVSLRQFDISDRTDDRVSAIVQVMPTSSLAFSGTVAAGREDRPQAAFGLQSNDNYSYAAGVDYVPNDQVSLGAEYEYEHFSTLQASRQANPPPSSQFTDPTRDWTTDAADLAHTFTASADWLKIARKTDLRLDYQFSRAQSTYVYGLAPNTSLGPIQQLTPVLNSFMRGTVDVQHHVKAHVAIGLQYAYDRYRVQDFALGTQTLDSLAKPSLLMLGYVYRPYTANTVWGRVSYIW